MPRLQINKLYATDNSDNTTADLTIPTLAAAPADGAILYLKFYYTITSGAPAQPTLTGNLGGASDWAIIKEVSDATGNQRITVWKGTATTGATTGATIGIAGQSRTGIAVELYAARNCENSDVPGGGGTNTQAPVSVGPTAGATSQNVTFAAFADALNGCLVFQSTNANAEYTAESGHTALLTDEGGELNHSSPGTSVASSFLDEEDANSTVSGTFGSSGRMMSIGIEVPHGTDAATPETSFELVGAVASAAGDYIDLTWDPPADGLTGTPDESWLDPAVLAAGTHLTSADHAARELGYTRITDIREDSGQLKYRLWLNRLLYDGETVAITYGAGLWTDAADEASLAVTSFAVDVTALDTLPQKQITHWDNELNGQQGAAELNESTIRLRLRVRGVEPTSLVQFYVKAYAAGDWTTTEVQQYTAERGESVYEPDPNNLGLMVRSIEYVKDIPLSDFLNVDSGKWEAWAIVENAVGAIANTQTDPAGTTAGVIRGYFRKIGTVDNRVARYWAAIAPVGVTGTATGNQGIYATEAEMLAAIANAATTPAGVYPRTPAGLLTAVDEHCANKLSLHGAEGATADEFDNADNCVIGLSPGDYTIPDASAVNAHVHWIGVRLKAYTTVGAYSGEVRITDRSGATSNTDGFRVAGLVLDGIKVEKTAAINKDRLVPLGGSTGQTRCGGWNHTTNVQSDTVAPWLFWINGTKRAYSKSCSFQVFGTALEGRIILVNHLSEKTETAVYDPCEGIFGILCRQIGKDGQKSICKNVRGLAVEEKSIVLGKCDDGTFNSGTNELVFESPDLNDEVFVLGEDNWRFADDLTSLGSKAIYRVLSVVADGDTQTVTIEDHTADFASYTGGAYTHGGGTPRLLVKAGAFSGRSAGDKVWVNSATGLGAPFEDTIAVKIDSDQVQLTTGNAGMDGAPDVAFDAATAGPYVPADPAHVYGEVAIGDTSRAHGDGYQTLPALTNHAIHGFRSGPKAGQPAWKMDGKGIQIRADGAGEDHVGLWLSRVTLWGDQYANITTDLGKIVHFGYEDCSILPENASGANRGVHPVAGDKIRVNCVRRSTLLDYGAGSTPSIVGLDCGVYSDSDAPDRVAAWGKSCTYGGLSTSRVVDPYFGDMRPKTGGELLSRVAVNPDIGPDWYDRAHDGAIGAEYGIPLGSTGVALRSPMGLRRLRPRLRFMHN